MRKASWALLLEKLNVDFQGKIVCPEDELCSTAISHLSFVNGSFSGTGPVLTLFGSSLDFFGMTSPHPASMTTGSSYISY